MSDDEDNSGESKALEALPDNVKDVENLDIAANSDRAKNRAEEEVEQLSNSED